jgi:phage internal scaffolding protein
MTTKFKVPYRERSRFTVKFLEPSRTKQSHRDECDINTILQGYNRTGLLQHVAQHQGVYDDVSDVPSYHEAMNLIARAGQSFDLLPADMRKRFSNDPAEFLAFVHDEKNREEMVKMGLIPEPRTPVDMDDPPTPPKPPEPLPEGSE